MPLPPSHPKVQKRMPAPFQRPVIDLDAARVKRDWRMIPVSHVKPDDIVADFGLVEGVDVWLDCDTYEQTVTLHHADGRRRTYAGVTQQVYAFTPVEA